MLKFHIITAFMKMHANFQKIFLIKVFWFKYIFPTKYKIRILDLMLLPKNSVPFEGLFYSSAGLRYFSFAQKSSIATIKMPPQIISKLHKSFYFKGIYLNNIIQKDQICLPPLLQICTKISISRNVPCWHPLDNFHVQLSLF